MENDTQPQPNITPTPNINFLIKKAEEIYLNLKKDTEPSQNGKYIAIEVESGEHFIADTREEAVKASKTKYPDRIPFTRKIGELEKASRHLASGSRLIKYDRVL